MKNRVPMRVIEGSAQPFEPFWRFRDAGQSESGEVEIEFFGPISEYSWFGDEITPEMFKKELNQRGKDQPVTVLVNSPGGEVIAASVIRSILQEYSGKVTADIVGLAASAATIMVTGADYIRMRESALFMIHDPSTVAWGTIDEIQKDLDVLKIVKDTITDVYQTKTKMAREKLSQMMTAETWLTAREAKDFGFVDEVVTGSIKKAAKAWKVPAGFANCLTDYLHVPEELKNRMSEPVETAIPQPVSAEERRLRDEILLLKGAK